MRKLTVLLLTLIVATLSITSHAQETRFGKNKVRYKDFNWSYIQTRHFDIHFYEDAYETAKFASHVAESSYVEISHELDYLVQKRMPLFIYNSHNDFQQTNVINSLIGEGTGGFTEVFKNRMVVPFNGSYEDFRHVLHHELTHAIVNDLLYGNAFSSLVSRQKIFQMPLWLAEGFAEYSSRHGWDYFSDMWVRDATINGYLYPPMYLGGYGAYRQGQAMVKYIADNYGENKIGELFKNGKVYLSMKSTLDRTLEISEKKFWEDFSKEMKRRYWPEIAKRSEIGEIGQELTKSIEDGSYFNEKPVFSPEGDVIAMFTDRWDYVEIVLISADNGKLVKRLVKGSRSGDMESLHAYVSGVSFSPDGQYLVFVAKSKGKESLFFYDMHKNKVTIKKRFDYYNLLSPSFSPSGTKVAFSALEGNQRDLFIYDMTTDLVTKLTSDRFDDVDPVWIPDTDELVFASDRAHPDNTVPGWYDDLYTTPGAIMPGGFEYGSYNLFRITESSGQIEPLRVGPGQNKKPAISPDGSKVAFISNRNGIDNVYIANPDSGKAFAVTDILTGIMYVSWSPDGKKLAVEAFERGAMDIFLLKDLVPAGENGVLELTDFYKGAYSHYARAELKPIEDSTELQITTDEILDFNAIPDEIPDSLTAPVIEVAQIAENDSTNTSLIDTTTAIINDSPAARLPSDIEPTSDTTIAVEEEPQPGQPTIIDGEFVYISPVMNDPLDGIMADIEGDSAGTLSRHRQTEPESFDSIPPPSESGDYDIMAYKVKLTTDYIGGGFAYDTFFGLRGQTVFMFSDYLGNHSIVLVANLVNTIDQSDVQAYYFNSINRIGFGAGLFHSKNYYLDSDENLFSDRFYGFQFFAQRPFSTFSRIELNATQHFIDREYYYDPYTEISQRENRNAIITTGTFSWVTDNIIWGLTGPVNGKRAKISLTAGGNVFDSKSIEFYSAELDYRKYFRLNKSYSFAFRFSAGGSTGKTPKTYFLGGTTNWIGNRTLDAEVYDVENLYFADVVTPLRGVDYYSLSGNRYALLNVEFRYPMIDYFAMRFPLPLVLSRVGGAIFFDMGTALREGEKFEWGTSENGDRLKDVKVGFGFGMRANLGFMLLRYDIAWGTDFWDVSDRPSYYFSVGADF